jgi:hypothetical protein
LRLGRRHWLAHGFLILKLGREGTHQFEFRRYVQQHGDKFDLTSWRATIDDLQNAADAINRYTIAFVAIHERIYREQALER